MRTKRAKVSHLDYLPWWRDKVLKSLDAYPMDDTNQRKLSTVPRAFDPNGVSQQSRTRLPTPSNPDSEGSDGEDFSRRRRGTAVETTSTNIDLSKRIKKESLGVFDPDNPDDRDNQGLITTSSGKPSTLMSMFSANISQSTSVSEKTV
ncbi:hypothetical protein IL306_010929 [Fusarium sp. DS 682]|nr:hypothetical protein IL306_010929 [Fusarium sp. DS 682]